MSHLPPRRCGRVALLAVAGIVLCGAVVVRVSRRRRPVPQTPQIAAAPVGPGPVPSDPSPSRSLMRMAFGAAMVVVLSLVIVVMTRPSGVAHSAAAPVEGPLPLADCQAALAARTNPNDGLTCGYDTGVRGSSVDEEPADPTDPRYAGSALPTELSTGGRTCVSGPERPVLDTVRPVLSASFTAVPGLRLVESTFQLRGVHGPTADDIDLPGDTIAAIRTATLDFMRRGPLAHGVSYRWRVRGTPASIAAGGWSRWCEFTVATTTPDDLGLTDGRDYTAVVPVATWREILAVLGPVETYDNGDRSPHAPIETAVKAAARSAARVAVTLRGSDWKRIVNDVSSHASQEDEPAYWQLADVVSAALGGPEHPTMGFPRPPVSGGE